jgi:hypothetical protein
MNIKQIKKENNIIIIAVLMILIGSFSFINIASSDTFETMSEHDYTFVDSDGITWYIKALTEGDGNWTAPTNISEIDVLVVAGGGGSGKGTTSTNVNAGGGGAGGLIWLKNMTVTSVVPISYSIGAVWCRRNKFKRRNRVGIQSSAT